MIMMILILSDYEFVLDFISPQVMAFFLVYQDL